jgi:hypothetical protein
MQMAMRDEYETSRFLVGLVDSTVKWSPRKKAGYYRLVMAGWRTGCHGISRHRRRLCTVFSIKLRTCNLVAVYPYLSI